LVPAFLAFALNSSNHSLSCATCIKIFPSSDHQRTVSRPLRAFSSLRARDLRATSVADPQIAFTGTSCQFTSAYVSFPEFTQPWALPCQAFAITSTQGAHALALTSTQGAHALALASQARTFPGEAWALSRTDEKLALALALAISITTTTLAISLASALALASVLALAVEKPGAA